MLFALCRQVRQVQAQKWVGWDSNPRLKSQAELEQASNDSDISDMKGSLDSLTLVLSAKLCGDTLRLRRVVRWPLNVRGAFTPPLSVFADSAFLIMCLKLFRLQMTEIHCPLSVSKTSELSAMFDAIFE